MFFDYFLAFLSDLKVFFRLFKESRRHLDATFWDFLEHFVIFVHFEETGKWNRNIWNIICQGKHKFQKLETVWFDEKWVMALETRQILVISYVRESSGWGTPPFFEARYSNNNTRVHWTTLLPLFPLTKGSWFPRFMNSVNIILTARMRLQPSYEIYTYLLGILANKCIR